MGLLPGENGPFALASGPHKVFLRFFCFLFFSLSIFEFVLPGFTAGGFDLLGKFPDFITVVISFNCSWRCFKAAVLGEVEDSLSTGALE